MPDDHLSLWVDEVPTPARRWFGLRAGIAPTSIRLEFVDEADRPVGQAVDAPIPRSEQVEVPGGGGGFEWARVRPPVDLSVATVPAGAAGLRAFAGGRQLGAAPMAATAARPVPPTDRKSFNAAGRWKLIAVSEGFADADAFFAACEDLHNFILAMAPFNDPQVAGRFGIEALFWPSGPNGLFNTKTQGRLVFGDNARVKRLVGKGNVSGELIVVLVNSPVRGGAGGTRDRPAWVTTTSAPTEHWEAVALHEIGHSFGLADEYDDSSQTTPEPSRLEPNVTKQRDAANAPWAALRNLNVPNNPTCAAGALPTVSADTVGTFEGARYKPRGRYRPVFECLMRRTDRPLCPVCQAHIRRILAAT